MREEENEETKKIEKRWRERGEEKKGRNIFEKAGKSEAKERKQKTQREK